MRATPHDSARSADDAVRRVAAAVQGYRVEQFRFASGEQFSCVVDAVTGVPATLALRFALHERRRGSWRRLDAALRAVATLYSAYPEVSGGHSLEADLRKEVGPTEWQLRRLITAVEKQVTARTGAIAHIAPGPLGGRRGAAVSPRAHNRRLAAWRLFLLWAINPSAWSTREPPSTPAARQVRADRRTELEAFFADATSPEPRSVSFKPLTSEELVAVERAIGPDARGVYPSVFRRELAERNWLLYEVHRWGGLRRGEVLTLFVIDLPSAASASNVIQVVRRPDDPAEVRGRYAPNVKREGRGVPLPGTLVDELRRYGSAGRRGTTTPYLFVADSGRPLSVARAHRVVKQIGEAAASRFEAAHPGVPHTLRQLSWHRLRHTRAEELLDEFLPESPAAPVPGGESAFLDLFGWATRDSATPYIRRRLGQRADRRLAARDAELTHRYHPEATQ